MANQQKANEMRNGRNILFAFLDEAFETLAPVGYGSLSAQAQRDRSEDGTFTATILTDDEVD